MNSLIGHLIETNVKGFLNKIGYDITKLKYSRKIDDLTEKRDDLQNIFFYAKSNIYPYLCYAPIEFLRGHVMAFRFDNKLTHPFAKAVIDAKEKKDKKASIKRTLQKYYSVVRPQNAAEVLGLRDIEAPRLAEVKPWIVSHPWQDRTIKEIASWRPKMTLNENIEYGAKIGIEHGWHMFGPVSDKKLIVEDNRLFKIMNSILKNGYTTPNNYTNISSVLLINDNNECRWVVYNGQHRTSVLCGLGYKSIPVLVEKIVEKKDVKLWPGVKCGDFTIPAALKVFDKVFAGITSVDTNILNNLT